MTAEATPVTHGAAFAEAATALATADTVACLSTMRRGSKTFFLAARLLPRGQLADFAAIYAFCREADDAVDLTSQPRAALATLHARLAAVRAAAATVQQADASAPRPRRGRKYVAARAMGAAARARGEAAVALLPSPTDRALARVVGTRALSLTPLYALLEGFAWDAEGRTYPTLRDTLAYSARAAGSVGVLLAELMGVQEPWALGRAADLGVAMQLTNICRDVGEDARNGRVYLPGTWLRRAGVAADALGRSPRHDPALAEVVARLLRLADALYARAREGMAALPLGPRLAVAAAQRLYAEIGGELARRGHDAVSQRTVVPGTRKAWLVARAVLEAPWLPLLRAGQGRYRPVSPTSAFLLAAGEPGQVDEPVGVAS